MTSTAFLELLMLCCFGASWPLASLRMWRERRAIGRGLLPTALTLCGYLAGMAAKICFACDGAGLAPIFWMYLLNAASVALNIALQWRFADPAHPTADVAGASGLAATPAASRVPRARAFARLGRQWSDFGTPRARNRGGFPGAASWLRVTASSRADLGRTS